MNQLISRTVNRKLLAATLSELNISADRAGPICERLENLLLLLQRIEKDVEADRVRDIKGIRPQDRRNQLSKIADKLDDSREELNIFRAPNLRYQENPELPRTRPLGLPEIRNAASRQFSSVLTAAYISDFGLEPLQWSLASGNYHLNQENRAEAIEFIAEEIIENLLVRLAETLRDAANKIADNTPGGGRRESKIIDTLLLNVVAIAAEVIGRGKKVSYNRGETKFFKLCKGICVAVGAGNYCTETHVKRAACVYNDRRNLQ